MSNYVIVFTSGDPAHHNNWPSQAVAFHTAVKQATGATPTPLMRTEADNALVLSVQADVDANAMLSAITKRLPVPLFQLRKSHGTSDCVLVFEVGDVAATEEVARAAFGLSKR